MEFRVCKKCFKYKPLSKFRKDRGIIRLDCKACESIGRGERRNKVREFYIKYKNRLGCRECGESRFGYLNFHHRNPDEKELNIATAVGAYGIKTIMNEIAKCDVLCTNCHAKLHHDLRKEEKIKLERGIIMGQYTKEEIKVFEDKELRIVRQAIMKKLIEKLPVEDIYGVTRVTELTEKYVDHVYSERQLKRKDTSKGGEEGAEQPNWEQIAVGLNLAIPTSQNIKMLNYLVSEHNKANKASANPADILVHIMEKFGQYPTKTESVEKVLKTLT